MVTEEDDYDSKSLHSSQTSSFSIINQSIQILIFIYLGKKLKKATKFPTKTNFKIALTVSIYTKKEFKSKKLPGQPYQIYVG